MGARQTEAKREVNRGMVKVWDIFVRFSHWMVALGFFVAFWTEEDLITLHVWAGYLVGVLVVLRLLWGFVGPKHARFSDFLAGPRSVLVYITQLVTFRAPRHLGHSPAGGAMAIVLWLGLIVVVWTGMEFYALDQGRGPLAALPENPGVSAASVHVVAPAAAQDDEGGAEELERNEGSGRGGRAWGEVHETLASLVMALVVLHLAGVLLACLAHRENLVRAMWDGKKRAE
jgi:cytochrome b